MEGRTLPLRASTGLNAPIFVTSSFLLPFNAREDGHNKAHGAVFVVLLCMVLNNNEGPSDQARANPKLGYFGPLI